MAVDKVQEKESHGQYVEGGQLIFYSEAIKGVKKSNEPLQPIYEAVTNSLEALSTLQETEKKISIDLRFIKDLHGNKAFDSISVQDNGEGFNDENFGRFLRFKDSRKGFNNRGSGRIQFLHYFDKTEFQSRYRMDAAIKERQFLLSKKFLKHNSLVFDLGEKEIDDDKGVSTTVTFKSPLDDKYLHILESLTADGFKAKILSRYVMYLCTHRDKLPSIVVQEWLNSELVSSLTISEDDIPHVDQKAQLNLKYSKLSSDGRQIEVLDKGEEFELSAFKIDSEKLEENSIKLTVKGEIIDGPSAKIRLGDLKAKDQIDDSRYLFLISSNYLDDKVGDNRGDIELLSSDDLKKGATTSMSMFNREEILKDEIEDKVNMKIVSLYKEIRKAREEKNEQVSKLRDMFLLNSEVLDSLKIGVNDSEERILEKVYQADVKTSAKSDADIKKQIDKLDSLNPSSDEYAQIVGEIADEFATSIPLQNRAALTRYVARRKIVLEVFNKILKRELDVQKSDARNDDEGLLHNLLFKKRSKDSSESDLWLISEEYIYFSGASEERLEDVKIGGESLLRSKLTEEERKYRYALEENRFSKRPDILLFPEEGKCIILELKNPDKNVSDYLNQIQNYATLILNFANPVFDFTTFYGYLIGEKIDPFDVQSHDSDFKHSSQFDYLFRPSKTVLNRFGKNVGNIYMEVLKFSSLLDRARTRNNIFIDHLKKS